MERLSQRTKLTFKKILKMIRCILFKNTTLLKKPIAKSQCSARRSKAGMFVQQFFSNSLIIIRVSVSISFEELDKVLFWLRDSFNGFGLGDAFPPLGQLGPTGHRGKVRRLNALHCLEDQGEDLDALQERESKPIRVSRS